MRQRNARSSAGERHRRRVRPLAAGLLLGVALVLAGCVITPTWLTWRTNSDGTHTAALADSGCTLSLVAGLGVTPIDGDGGYQVSGSMMNTCKAGVDGAVALTMSTSTDGTHWTAEPDVTDRDADGRTINLDATAISWTGGPKWFKVHAAGIAQKRGKVYTTTADYGPVKVGPYFASWQYGGSDATVNTSGERQTLLAGLNASDWDIWGGVAPSDRGGMRDFISAQNDADGEPAEETESIDVSAATDVVEPEPPVDAADVAIRSQPRSLVSSNRVRVVNPVQGNWVTIRSLVNALVTGNAKKGWRLYAVSERDKVHEKDADDAVWGYVANKYNKCGWIKKSKADQIVPDEPVHGCSDENQIPGDTFTSLINCNFCNAGWPVLVKNDDVPIFRNIPPRGASQAPYILKNTFLQSGGRVHWRYVSANGKWVSIWANVVTEGVKASKWAFVRLSDLKRRGDISVLGDGLCRGVSPHVPHGYYHPIKERWPLVCTEHEQPNAGASW